MPHARPGLEWDGRTWVYWERLPRGDAAEVLWRGLQDVHVVDRGEAKAEVVPVSLATTLLVGPARTRTHANMSRVACKWQTQNGNQAGDRSSRDPNAAHLSTWSSCGSDDCHRCWSRRREVVCRLVAASKDCVLLAWMAATSRAVVGGVDINGGGGVDSGIGHVRRWRWALQRRNRCLLRWVDSRHRRRGSEAAAT